MRDVEWLRASVVPVGTPGGSRKLNELVMAEFEAVLVGMRTRLNIHLGNGLLLRRCCGGSSMYTGM
jgi:hypothetical protein